MLTLGGLAAVMLFVNLAMPHRLRLIGVALLLVPQIYLPEMPIELASLAVLWTVFTCVAGMVTRGRARADSQLVVIMVLFAAVTAVSLVWALPSAFNNGAAFAVRSAVFALWLREMIVVAKEDPGLLNTVALWTAPGVAAQALLTIAFRVNPARESRFLHSKLAGYLVGPQSRNLYSDWANNVVYPFKAGGLFVNGNMASLFGAVAALLLIVAARRSGTRWPYWVAALSLTGSVFTGSKTFIFIALACLAAVAFLPHAIKGGWALLGAVPILLVLPVVNSIFSDLLESIAPGLYRASNRSYGGRQTMWNGGTELFGESPLFGLGFGGWGERIGRFTGEYGVPPHNFLLAAWANSGLVALFVAIAFVGAAVIICLRTAAAQLSLRERRTVVLAFCAGAWVFLHGMGDNTTLYGEQHSMILVALVYAYVYAMMPANNHKPAGVKDDKPFASRDFSRSLVLAGR